MAQLGIDSVWLAIIDDKTGKVVSGVEGINSKEDDAAGVFEVNAKTSKGVGSLALSGLAGAFSQIYGSNIVVDTSQANAQPQAVLTVNDLPHEVKAKILDQESDGKGGFEIGGKTKTHLALLARSQEAFDDPHLYVSLYNVKGQSASETWTSNNQNETRSTDAITFNAMGRVADGKYGKNYFESVPGFDETAMRDDVFQSTTTAQG